MGRLRELDDLVFRQRPSVARDARGRKHGWSLFLLLGVALLSVCAWAVAAGRPAIAGMNVGFGAALVAVLVVSVIARRRSG